MYLNSHFVDLYAMVLDFYKPTIQAKSITQREKEEALELLDEAVEAIEVQFKKTVSRSFVESVESAAFAVDESGMNPKEVWSAIYGAFFGYISYKNALGILDDWTMKEMLHGAFLTMEQVLETILVLVFEMDGPEIRDSIQTWAIRYVDDHVSKAKQNKSEKD